MDTPSRPPRIFGVLSVALTPIAALMTFLVAMVIEAFVGRPPDGVIRVIVLSLATCVVAGLASAPISLVRGERPRWLPVFGLALTLSLIVLFHFSTGGE